MAAYSNILALQSYKIATVPCSHTQPKFGLPPFLYANCSIFFGAKPSNFGFLAESANGCPFQLHPPTNIHSQPAKKLQIKTPPPPLSVYSKLDTFNQVTILHDDFLAFLSGVHRYLLLKFSHVMLPRLRLLWF